MSDPIVAASAALVERVRAIDGTEAIAHLDALIAAVQARREELQQDWNACQAAILPLLQLVEEETFRIGDEANRAIDAMADLAEPLTGAAVEIVEDLHRAGPAVQMLANVADALEPDLGLRLETAVLKPGLAIAAEALALGASVREGLEAAVALVGDAFLIRTEEARESVTLCGDSILKIGGQVSAALAADYEEWAGRMQHAVGVVDAQGLRPLGPHAKRATDAALEGCNAAQTEPFARLAETAQAAHSMVSDIADRMEMAIATIDADREATEDAMDRALEALGDAVEDFGEVGDILATRGFGA